MYENQCSDALKQVGAYLVDGLEFKAVGLWLGKLVTATRGSQVGFESRGF